MKLLSVLTPLFLMLVACSAVSAVQPTASSATIPALSETSPTLPPAAPALDKPTALATVPADTPTDAGTATPTFPPELTRTPGIMQTATAYYASATADYLKNSALLGPMADLMGNLSQFLHPVGAPLKTWNGVPIMPQATAGQEFKSDIYSFSFPGTISQASQFYNAQSSALNWACIGMGSSGTSGSGSNALHSSTLICQNLVISINSFDSDPKTTIVVINKAP